ncbi:MAG: pre-peptidase C-terminal domain-containing protein [Myxococcaceae bacterium]|nr:pre-peptidase C-terminal domain-containing protein [Myxococcaceae bacterium]
MRNTLISFGLLFLACGQLDASIVGKVDEQGGEKQEERWSTGDDPALFGAGLEFKLDALPMNGEAQVVPWAGSYWPTYEDNINMKWDGAGSDAPSTKYGKAFGVTGIEDKVSKAHGIDSAAKAKECKAASECKSELGETCAKRDGKDTGRCIPTWWGICHAWSPAAILLPEPKHPVTRNGVTFKVQDLKALGSLVHNSSTSKFVSLRCDKGSGADDVVAFDEYGRPQTECRDTNAGTWHLLMTNYLGLRHQAFVEDRVWNHEVWNQPLRGFRVTAKKTITAAEANTLIGATTTGGTTVKKSGTVKKTEWAHQGSFPVTAGQSMKVIMSGSGDADLYVNFGAQPTEALYACRPYESGTSETCELTVPAGATAAFVSVQGYADSSTFGLNIITGGTTPSAYVFNKDAKTFALVDTDVSYIGEASSNQDGNLSSTIDRYTHSDHYQYVLELDAAGKIIGGEWVGDSKTLHPDFVWLPTGVATQSVAGGAITYAQVKSLFDESVQEAPPPGGTDGGVKTQTLTGTVAKNELKLFGPLNVAAGTTLTADLTGTGDADLYAKKGLAPTLTSYDCRPYKTGTAENCAVAGPGSVYVALNGYAATSTYTLTIKYTEASGTPPPPPPPPATITHLDVTGDVAQGAMKTYELTVPAGAKVRVATTSTKDVDLYVQFATAPTTSAYLKRAYTASGNETLEVTAPSSGTLVIGVYGYVAASFSLKTSTP